MYVCMCECMYVSVYKHVCMYVCMYGFKSSRFETFSVEASRHYCRTCCLNYPKTSVGNFFLETDTMNI